MYQSLELFQTAGAMARHAGAQQATVASNIANADTPGYRAQTLASFGDTYRDGPGLAPRRTRPGHMVPDPMQGTLPRAYARGGEAAPNGNDVAIEDEMLASVAASRDHNRALAVYRHGMTVLRTALGRG
jgi:flagellar basal-body rod protein FlgB